MSDDTPPFRIRNGHIVTSYFIFMRTSPRVADDALLRVLGIDFVRHGWDRKNANEARVFITEDDAWIHIADDLRYHLWHRRDAVEALHRFRPDATIFACSRGDCDYSFDFKYYDDGRLLRHFEVADPNYNKRPIKVITDLGTPLPGEKPLDRIEDEMNYLLAIAESLGVNTQHRSGAVRCYAYDAPR